MSLAPDAVDLLRRAAAAAAAAQQYPAPALYVVGTPIGNLADLTLRAIHVLGLVDAVACEDTRVSAGLLRHLGIDKPLLALHEHNETAAAQAVVERLQRGERVAYVSDAGTPALSDPGARLVAAVQAAGLRSVPVPGASSAMTALSVAGDPGSERGLRFVGFLPAKGREREAALTTLAAEPQTQILFEAPHRVSALAAELAQRMPERRVAVCRELTKQFETVAAMAAGELPAWLEADAQRRRGEFVFVLHASERAPQAEGASAEPALRLLLAELPLKQAVSLAAALTGAPRNALYQRALALRGGGPEAAADEGAST